jgi:sugar phosphate isomerase/epimerase
VPEGYPAGEAWNELVRAGRHLADVAERHGVTLVFEPLKPSSTNLILTLAEGHEFVRRVDRPQLRVMADMFHMRENAETWADIAELGADLGYVHLCDHDRRAPGSTPEDLASYSDVFATLQSIDYRGRVSIEAEWREVGSDASRAIEALAQAAATG